MALCFLPPTHRPTHPPTQMYLTNVDIYFYLIRRHIYIIQLQETRGAALGFFNWGVYVGYSVTFLLTIAEQELGWRSVYFLAGAPGIILSVFVMTTVREPARNPSGEVTPSSRLYSASIQTSSFCLFVHLIFVQPVIGSDLCDRSCFTHALTNTHTHIYIYISLDRKLYPR